MKLEAAGRIARDPVVQTGLAVDLLPVIGILALGWDGSTLVMLYWLDNLIIGLCMLPRIFLSGGRFGVSGYIGGALATGFFALHYGLFCAVHGTFLAAFQSLGDQEIPAGQIAMSFPGLVMFALSTGQWLFVVAAILLVWRGWALVVRFIRFKDWRETNPIEEMFAPYLGIAILHGVLFVGLFVWMLLGEPLWGVFALLFLRMFWSIWANTPRTPRPEAEPPLDMRIPVA